ncbi:MAG: ABC transporter permease [Acidobacteria bacterium]|nr:ABC transporter permease [Acidobacteriota bacterium]
MFLRLVADSFGRRPRHKLLTGAALALGMAVATAALSVSLDVGDRLSREFRSLGANLIVTPEADSLPIEIGGVDYLPANVGAYLPESDIPKIKTIFWHNNIIAFAPTLDVSVRAWSRLSQTGITTVVDIPTKLIGTWAAHSVALSDGNTFGTGIGKTSPWWHINQGRWFSDDAQECIVGEKLLTRAGIKLGDALHIEGPKENLPLKVVGVLAAGGSEDESIVAPIAIAQRLVQQPGKYHQLYVSALSKPQDDFARRDPKTMNPDELERWSCAAYVSSIAYSIKQVLPGAEVRVVRRVAEGEGRILSRVQMLLWLVTLAALLAAALAVGASSAASVIERRSEIGLMKALGAGSGTIGFLLAAEQLLLAVAGGAAGYVIGVLLARIVGQKIFGATPQPSLLVLAVILGLAAAVTLAGSAIPLRRAARYEPALILRGE